ncbi:hypothetical protein F4777DRAFT_529765 [Nemania sp. FL0916]|nr:hypothetical protein F4777DRAFT_529765 [Nemania sp. FL0916]
MVSIDEPNVLPMSFNPSHLGFKTIASTSVLTLLALLSLSIHIIVRVFIHKNIAFDDFLTVLAFAISLSLVGKTIWCVAVEGWGEHVANVTHTHLEMIAKSLLVDEELWSFVNTLIRASGLIFSIKMISEHRLARAVATYALIFSILHGLSTLIVGALICRPLNAAWDSSIKGACINQTASFISLEAIGLAIDIMILSIPLFVFARLDKRLREKCGTLIMFSVGTLVTIITGLRIASLHRIRSLDLTYDQAYLGLLSTLGALISIIATCIPSFPCAYRYAWEKYSNSRA